MMVGLSIHITLFPGNNQSTGHRKICKIDMPFYMLVSGLLKGVKGFRKVILVTGTPAVGKTSVSCLLASKLDAVHVNLTELVKQEKLISGVDKVRKTLIANTDKLSKRVQEIIGSSERDIIIDGHYAVDVTPANEIHVVFVLRRNPNELKGIMENRGFKGRKLWENLAVEILDVCLCEALSACGSEKVCEIDASGKKVEDIVESMISVLEGKKKCEVGIVDWLGRLETEGQLQDFLKDF
jgi:adenylate kinase